MDKSHHDQTHIPVLLDAVLDYLAPQEGEAFLDVTAGYGGHSQPVLERTLNPQKAVLVDRDGQAIKHLRERFSSQGATVVHDDFLNASKELQASGRRFDMILADLGLSSPQLAQAERGFAISRSGPLDMRMDARGQVTAAQLVNHLSEEKLAEILRLYGQEPKARQIARRIVAARPINSTDELAKIAGKVWLSKSRMHPATRTFQALRIAVNEELVQLQDSLPHWLQMLEPGGRMVVISFHSLEDRIVKRFFADNAGHLDSELVLLTKRPITADAAQIDSNPRARSAKLRAAAKIKTKRKDRTTS